MLKRVVESWMWLLYFDGLMTFSGFEALQDSVREQGVREVSVQTTRISDLCHAIDMACVLYFKPVLCLQRSAATTILLRRNGWPGSLVIGAQLLPFQSHAWVEVDDHVVNDKPYVHDMFQVLDRC